jgi:hypothetical protein
VRRIRRNAPKPAFSVGSMACATVTPTSSRSMERPRGAARGSKPAGTRSLP